MTTMTDQLAQFIADLQRQEAALKTIKNYRSDMEGLGTTQVAEWPVVTFQMGLDYDSRDLRPGLPADGTFVLTEAPIYIDETGGISILEIRAKARRLAAEQGIDLLVLDYLQLAHGERRAERKDLEIAEISAGLKGLAKELNIPIIAISQLSRAVESRSPQIPKLSDLRESGSIEQDADIVMFLYREDREKPDTPNKNIVDVYISKHRNGPIGKISLYFNENLTTFKSLERTHTE